MTSWPACGRRGLSSPGPGGPSGDVGPGGKDDRAGESGGDGVAIGRVGDEDGGGVEGEERQTSDAASARVACRPSG